MRKFIIEDKRYISPFNEPASEMSILNKPVKLIQRDTLAPYCDGEHNINDLEDLIPYGDEEMLVYRDNLYFDEEFFREFMTKARTQAKLTNQPGRASFWPTDKAFVTYALPLSQNIKAEPKR